MLRSLLLLVILGAIGCSPVKETLTVVNGTDGKDGSSCSVSDYYGEESQPLGALISCTDGTSSVLLNGLNGEDGEDAIQSGLSCNVHNLANWDGVTNILTVLSASAPVGNFTLANLNVGNSLSANGFPSMPSALQNAVGLTGYALDCSGYLNIKTSGLYNFNMLSDDGVRLVIDNKVIINNPSLHPPTSDVANSIELNKGQRTFNVIYYQGPATQIALQLKYSGPNASSLVVIPSTEFTH